jgi:MFS family permease
MTIPSDPRASAASPLPPLLALSFLCSIGTGIATSGIYFLTDTAYRFQTVDNYKLGLFQGLTYVAAAFIAGRVVRALRLYARLSSRTILALIIAALGLLCFIPILALRAGDQTPPSWPIWLMVLLYSPLTGFLWPIVESYISGGRSGHSLRRALGTWNLWWSSALVLGFFLMGPLLGSRSKPGPINPQQLIALLGLIHLLTLAILFKLSPEPGRHLHESHEPHPPVYTELLGTFRILLPTSYFVLTALQPYLPKALKSLTISQAWIAPLASAWLLARVLTFFALDRWHGWHGKWSLAIASIILLIGGFALAVLAPAMTRSDPAQLPAQNTAIAATLLGLFAFGIGMAMTYTAALYYAMEVGASEVDAGGTHESLIGVGYAAGPALGLLAWTTTNEASTTNFEQRVVLLVGGLALLAFIAAALHAHRHSRATR